MNRLIHILFHLLQMGRLLQTGESINDIGDKFLPMGEIVHCGIGDIMPSEFGDGRVRFQPEFQL